LDRRGEKLDFAPTAVAAKLEQAYSARDGYLLEALLNLALLRPSREYTQIVCRILEDAPNLPLGVEEAALDVLEELMDPASFDALVRVISRPWLAFDPTDWRKGLQAIAGFYRRDLIELPVVERALEKIAKSGNAIAPMAMEQLTALRDFRNKRPLRGS
jgi:hypothetical protein